MVMRLSDRPKEFSSTYANTFSLKKITFFERKILINIIGEKIYGFKLRLKISFFFMTEKIQQRKTLVVALVVFNQQCGVTNTNSFKMNSLASFFLKVAFVLVSPSPTASLNNPLTPTRISFARKKMRAVMKKWGNRKMYKKVFFRNSCVCE